jgi:hypothetical protein
MKKKILILSDSLALPRKYPEVCNYEDTWPQIIKREGFEIHQVSIGGATSQDLLRQCHYHAAFNPDVVIVQVGIVDCAPRFMTKPELSMCRQIPFVGTKIINLINKPWIIKRRKITYVKHTNFSRNVMEISRCFKDVEVFFLGILPACDTYEKTLPGIKKNILQYNKILQKNAKYLSLDHIDNSGIMSDFHHLNSKGHQLVYNKLRATILND